MSRQFARQFVQDKAPEHGLFLMTSSKCSGNLFRTTRLSTGYLPRRNFQCQRQFVQDEAPENGLFVEDVLRMGTQFVQDEPAKHGLFFDDLA